MLKLDYVSDLQSKHPSLFTKGIQIVDGMSLLSLHYPPFSTALPVLITSGEKTLDTQGLAELLLAVYPENAELLILPLLQERALNWEECSLSQLKIAGQSVAAIFIPTAVNGSSLEEFMNIISRLRAPDGCPWDKKQTHASLRPYLLEESYEALEALDQNDLNALREELGDLMLQIALHAQIAAENHSFTISDVLSGINQKIISRHPHVFGDISVKDERDVVQNWEKLKEIERAENGKTDLNGLLDGIPAILPALAQAQSIQERAARVGFDWPEIKPVLDKVIEELDEVATAPGDKERALELGDLLFAVVNLVRWYKVDAESALRLANTKFRKRFAYIEDNAKKNGKELQKMTLKEMDLLWEEAKDFDD